MKNNQLVPHAIEVLGQLKNTIAVLSVDDYTSPIPILSNSTIGEHTRHIVELFQQLLKGYSEGEVDYDNRERNIRIQTEQQYAMDMILLIIDAIDIEEKALKIVTSYNDRFAFIESNYHRELLYNIEHCIHHQALIKVGLLIQNLNVVSEDFGVAKSTLEFRKQLQNQTV
jgi:hypothetical protein